MTNDTKTPNKLVNASSPYLLQHAYNPVNWYPWGEEALNKAVKEDKPIIVSIGYAACHWCHVMERESFENEKVAEVMNEHFICIKVDREERPDVDQVYMDAVQAMGIHGGWPLNVITTPDQQPFYGGTYFPADRWTQMLKGVHNAWINQRDKIMDSAKGFTNVIGQSDIEKYGLVPTEQPKYNRNQGELFVHRLAEDFDTEEGGMDRAPKFPMPVLWELLLLGDYFYQEPNWRKQLVLTLDKMYHGGIYDQVGGGFARYSVDALWFAPHFEKMLYDNGQLLALYAKAYRHTGNKEYLAAIRHTVSFIEKELTDESGGLYASLDADSEGVEGKYYIWEALDLKRLLGEDYPVFKDAFGITEQGNWEHGQNILWRRMASEVLAEHHGKSVSELDNIINSSLEILDAHRSGRIKPGLDDKILASWNGLMLRGLVESWYATSDTQVLNLALQNGKFIASQMIKDGKLYRNYKNGLASISGFLDDYAAVIDGFIALYQATFDESWLTLARSLTHTAIDQFYDDKEGFFYYTSADGEPLIARKKELFDNVIPSSNAMMVENLFTLTQYFDDGDMSAKAEKMLFSVQKILDANPQYLAKWAAIYIVKAFSNAEIVVIGPDYMSKVNELRSKFRPDVSILASPDGKSDLPLIKGKVAVDGKTTIYVCENKTCKMPVFEVDDALSMMES